VKRKRTKLVSKARISSASFFPIQKNWRKLKPIFESKEAHSVWWPNMLEYAEQRANQNGYKLNGRHLSYEFPRDFDSCDWRYNRDRSGRQPAFWNYACHSACHWLVDLCLYVASTAYPDVQWRIVSSKNHSTVWNGDIQNPILFDVNFLAIGVTPRQALKLARTGRELKPGRILRWWIKYK